jgi:hypothetical protein
MRIQPLFQSLSLLAVALGCARHDPSFVPLGHGPLSQREQALQRPARAVAQRPRATPVDSAAASDLDERSDIVVTAASNAASPPTGSSATPESAAAGATNATATDPRAEWIGIYRGDDTTTFTLPEQPDRRFDDAKASINVELAADAKLVFHLVDSSNGKDICGLSASVDGTLAHVDAGQACFLDAEDGMVVKSRPGKATRSHRRLVFDLVLDTTMETESGTLEGSIVYHFDGQR